MEPRSKSEALDADPDAAPKAGADIDALPALAADTNASGDLIERRHQDLEDRMADIHSGIVNIGTPTETQPVEAAEEIVADIETGAESQRIDRIEQRLQKLENDLSRGNA